MELVGRDAEMRWLTGRLRAAQRGTGACVELVGEPGIGKTRVLDELCARAEGFTVLRGRGTEFESDLPYGLFTGLIDEAAAEDRHVFHRMVRASLARFEPLLLVLDDIHWADPASRELTAHLVRRPLAVTLLVLAYRPQRAFGGEQLVLGPLSRTDAEALLSSLPASRRDAAFDRSGGNPLFLEALARRGDSLPGEISLVVADELAALSADALSFARGAAVASEPFTPELAAAGGELDERTSLAALDELIGASLVSETGVPRRFRFRHPVIRQAVYAGAGPGWRLGAHARLETVLARQGAAPAVRAHHLEQCAQPGDRAAIDVLAAAAAAAATRAPSAAARWYAAALRLLPDSAARDERLALLVPRATALGSAGEFAASRDALRDVLDLIDDAALRGQVVAFVALIEQLLGRNEQARSLLLATLAEQADPVSPVATALRIELAKERYFAADWAVMRAHAADARAAASTPELLAVATGILALAEYHVPDVGAARSVLDEAAARLDALSDDQLAGRLDAALFVGWAEQCLARWDDVHRHYERALRVARATGQAYLIVPMTIGRAIAFTWQGALSAAAELTEEAIEIACLSGNEQSVAWSLTLRCWIATSQGDLDLALRAGEQGVATAARLAHTHWGALASCYLAEACLEAGDPERCHALLEPNLRYVGPAFQTRWYEILTRAALARGHFTNAARYAAHAEVAAADLGLPARLSEARRARALVLSAAGDVAGAARVALAAAADADAVGNTLDAARARLLTGDLQQLHEAETTFARCGALRWRDEAARALRRQGTRVARQGRRRRRPESGVGALTDRERDVASLLASGATNRGIAAQLHLSTKTVETHIANIFGKLGVRSRAAVAAVLVQA
jgi:DNA-binding NarL/FixJ family response regulator